MLSILLTEMLLGLLDNGTLLPSLALILQLKADRLHSVRAAATEFQATTTGIEFYDLNDYLPAIARSMRAD